MRFNVVLAASRHGVFMFSPLFLVLVELFAEGVPCRAPWFFQNCSASVVAEATLLEGEQGEQARCRIRTDGGKKRFPHVAGHALREVSQRMPGCVSSKSIMNSP